MPSVPVMILPEEQGHYGYNEIQRGIGVSSVIHHVDLNYLSIFNNAGINIIPPTTTAVMAAIKTLAAE